MSGGIPRRGLLGASSALLLAPASGVAVAAGHPDAHLLDLCARLESAARRCNSLWLQGVGTRFYVPSAYVEDDDERDKLSTPLEAEICDLFDQITDCTVSTADGYRAVTRCLALTETDLRQPAEEAVDGPWYTYRGLYVLHWLLTSLIGAAITPANCMSGPAQVRL